MSWTCPACERKYPDSSLALPGENPTEEYCTVCAVDPKRLQELIGKWRSHNGRSTQCANELEVLLEG